MDSIFLDPLIRNRLDQALRPREVQPAQNRFVFEGVYLYSEEQAEFSKKIFVGSEGYVYGVNTPVSPNASTILAPQTSPVVQSEPARSRSLQQIKTNLMASLGLVSLALAAYLSNLHRESCTSYLLND